MACFMKNNSKVIGICFEVSNEPARVFWKVYIRRPYYCVDSEGPVEEQVPLKVKFGQVVGDFYPDILSIQVDPGVEVIKSILLSIYK
jgi:hypothetical protein